MLDIAAAALAVYAAPLGEDPETPRALVFRLEAALPQPEAGAEAAAPEKNEPRFGRSRLSRAELYAQAIGPAGAPAGAPLCLLPEALLPRLPSGTLLLAGDAVGRLRPALEAAGQDFRLSAAPGQADAAQVAALAAARGLPPAAAPPPQPIYLRPPDVTRPAAQSRRRDG